MTQTTVELFKHLIHQPIFIISIILLIVIIVVMILLISAYSNHKDLIIIIASSFFIFIVMPLIMIGLIISSNEIEKTNSTSKNVETFEVIIKEK